MGLLILMACQPKSEVDKCVDANINRICNEVGELESGCRKYITANYEYEYREKCLRAQAGKDWKMKTAINKKLTITLVVLVWALVGCQSEVDKCTDAYVKRNTVNAECLTSPSGCIFPPVVIADSSPEGRWQKKLKEAEWEAEFRLLCLRASKGG